MSHHARILLIAPRVSDPAELLPALTAALNAARIDAVVLPLPEMDDRGLINFAKAFVQPIQAAGAVLLLEGRPDLVARSGADGSHIGNPKDLPAALEMLKPHERIVGCAGIRTKHEAMEAAESGVDYLMFGEPYPDGPLPDFDDVIDRLQWWAEVFETPCVAYAPTLEAVDALAATMAEFIGVGPAVFEHADGAAAAVEAITLTVEKYPLPVT